MLNNKYILYKVINKILSVIKRQDNILSRPRIVKLEQGEVSLQGFPKEVAIQLAEYVKAFKYAAPQTYGLLELKPELAEMMSPVFPIEEVLAAPLPKVVAPSPPSALPEKAISIYFDKINNMNFLVTVAYDIITKDAKVIAMDPTVGKRDVQMRFKQKASDLNFV